jgi:hypothetical protein
MPQPKPAAKFESANWFMPSAVRRVGRGTLELRGIALRHLRFRPEAHRCFFKLVKPTKVNR